MIAKGLDFPNVTLSGCVLNADTSLNLPDYRSSEGSFNSDSRWLQEGAGRGREKKLRGYHSKATTPIIMRFDLPKDQD